MKISKMDKKLQKLVIIIVAITVLIGLIFIVYPYPFFGPFESPPESVGGNCDQEYRFKFDTKITSAEDFIQFLKDHQYQGNLTGDYKPTMDDLIPSHASFIPEEQDNTPINLEALKTNVTIGTSKAIFSNEKIYTLNIHNDFEKYWPWSITVKMSETGHISIRYCAGI